MCPIARSTRYRAACVSACLFTGLAAGLLFVVGPACSGDPGAGACPPGMAACDAPDAGVPADLGVPAEPGDLGDPGDLKLQGAALSGLRASAGTLGPAFAPAALAYTLSVPAGVTQVQLTPTADGATITVNGAPVASGTPSAPFTIGSAPLPVTITVQQPGRSPTSYAVLLLRALSAVTYIKASNTEARDVFGERLALAGDTLAVCAGGEDSGATGVNGDQASNAASDSGAVYVFVLSGGTWTQQAYLKASNAGTGDRFGTSVALSASGDTLAVGATEEDSSASGINGNQALNDSFSSGAVYVFQRTGTAWVQQVYVKAANTREFSQFGADVALSASGDTLAVGAPNESSDATGINGVPTSYAARNSGAVYVLQRTGTTWAQQAYIKASNAHFSDLFGWSVALAGNDTLAVGAPETSQGGTAYVFQRTGATWAEQARLGASNTQARRLGRSIALSASGDTLAAGAPEDASSATGVSGDEASVGAPSSGAAYVFARTGTAWTRQAYVKASNTERNDLFGTSVALSPSGDTLAVGAPAESSEATGIDGSQTGTGASSAGAAYVFRRSSTTWAQSAYVKASNTSYNAFFGNGLAVTVGSSGETIAFGAYGEFSSATGIGGDQTNRSAESSGAVYLYR